MCQSICKVALFVRRSFSKILALTVAVCILFFGKMIKRSFKSIKREQFNSLLLPDNNDLKIKMDFFVFKQKPLLLPSFQQSSTYICMKLMVEILFLSSVKIKNETYFPTSSPTPQIRSWVS